MSRSSDVVYRHILGAVVIGLAIGAAHMEARAAPATKDLMPLQTGNSWTYRCSAEGENRFVKALRIGEQMRERGTMKWRLEMQSAGKRVSGFVWRGPDGDIRRSLGSAGGLGQVIATSRPRDGARIGDRTLRRDDQRSDLRHFGVIWRAESYPLQPGGDEDRNLRWSASWYAEGIGLVAEGSGDGGGCRIIAYKVGTRIWHA